MPGLYYIPTIPNKRFVEFCSAKIGSTCAYDPKIRGKDDVKFDDVVGIVPGITKWRARDGVRDDC